MISLLASAAFVCSTAQAQSTSTTSESLFGFDLDLHPRVFFPNTPQEHVGFPTAEAEALLDVVENRIPQMKKIIKTHEEGSALKDKQVALAEQEAAQWRGIAGDKDTVIAAQKDLIEAQKPSIIEKVLFSKELWLVAGVVLTVGAFELFDKD
jgi:hypothetical protein